MVKVSRSIRELNFKIRHATDEFIKKNEHPPTIQELAQVLVTTEEIVTASDALRDPASLHEQLYESEGDSITLMDQMKDENPSNPLITSH